MRKATGNKNGQRKAKKAPNTFNTKKEAMIIALENSLGVVSVACENVGINRTTHYNWLKEDSQYKDQVDSINEVSIDFAESQLYKRMKEGSDAAIIFFLKCRAKSRGYIERQEIVMSKPEPKNEEELKQEIDELQTMLNEIES